MTVRLLALDTATNACSAALSIDGVIQQRFKIAPRQHAELLLPMVETLLTEAGIILEDLNAIAFGAGPGSFMGVRIATGVAQGLAYGVNVQLIPVSTLQGLAQAAADQFNVNKVVAGWDARMHQVYWGAYEKDINGIMQIVIEDSLTDPDKITPLPNTDWLAAGNAWDVYQENLPATFLENISAKQTDVYPSAAAIVKIAEAKFHAGEALLPDQVQPRYLREQVV